MVLAGKTVLVVGAGISGVAAVKLLAAQSAKIILLEGNTKNTPQDIAAKFPEGITYDLILGEFPEQNISRIDLVVLSPGVPTDLPFVVKIQEAGIPIWGEVELAYVCGKGKVLAITGTNGKTTTTALTGEIMKAYYESVFVVGNIGLPYTEYALEMRDDTVTVAEVSSFQLETIHRFCPEVSAILNITPDHLNRHHTMECYAETKARIAMNQNDRHMCVLNYEDERLRALAEQMMARVFWFSSERELEEGIFLKDDEIICRDVDERILCNIHNLKLLGKHNYENVMAAAAIAYGAGVPWDIICKVVCEFQAVPHRIEFVREHQGVKYYNDSKGTNPDAAIKAVEAMVRPTIVIGGGYDKESSYEEWIASFGTKVKGLILLGETRDKIAEAAAEAGFTAVYKADSLEEAVKAAYLQAEKGDAVLLSPACASWDMFKNFEERGDLFKEYVNKL
ncbi:MAG: UDP-N-acetylmuramoyl-L-alanine--D-glutamate ligase [Lachnospiraceae bacterium]|nr:UDP-N-acetylmuramoyl-L-alanine--D-glutamate ligase [Lachnospiraceae bacterium]